ncbi:hypothetical protein TNCV_2636791 [Trichonephila clavipes]|uniref:Uncharacterized protein n=1 Tax=Trichonephila clavipes TaxID=2585209 RepID=A0A8X6R7T2_TRICX|nr:hypothetical protein TNCV_2636791 [Trichonephila clavipes]
MPEDQKISHLMKGVAEDLYQELMIQQFPNSTKDAPVHRTQPNYWSRVVEAIGRCMLRILGVVITLPDYARRP